MLFKEEQYVRKSRMGVITMSMLALISIVAILIVLFTSESTTDGIIVAVASILFIVPIIGIFAAGKLNVRIDNTTIRYRYFPFQFREKELKWSEVNTAVVRKYSPLVEFGGWGYKKNVLKNKLGLNVSGKVGLELTLESGKTIMIGTQKEVELRSFITKLELNNG